MTSAGAAPRLGIVGYAGVTHLGASFVRAAQEIGIDAHFYDAATANSTIRWRQSLSWRLADRQPAHIARFERELPLRLADDRVEVLLTTGFAPLRAPVLQALASIGVRTINFSSDDPWNPAHRSRWFLDAIRAYELILTPRRVNIEQFRAAGARRVEHLPFGYDPWLLAPTPVAGIDPAAQLLFVGTADGDRHRYVCELLDLGCRPLLVGTYWDRWPETRALGIGQRTPGEIAWLTAHAAACLILVRRANRDGHVMRSLEAAAAGGCLIVEDTADHRELYGADGDAVRYAGNASAVVEAFAELRRDPELRDHRAQKVGDRIRSGSHQYGQRLRQILELLGDRCDQT